LFFLLGENAEQYPHLVRQIYDDGHYIANHGYSDRMAHRMNDHDFRDNLIRGREAISAALGFDVYPRLFRPHGGFYRARHERIWIEKGYIMVPATIRVYDAVATTRNRDRIVKQTIKKVERQGGGIILLHDGRGTHYNRERALRKNPYGSFNRSWIPDVIQEIITTLLDRGFVLNNHDILDVIGIGSENYRK